MRSYFPLNWTRAFLSFLLLTVIASCTAVNNPTSTPARQGWDQNDLQQVVDEWRVRAGVPGMVVGISLPGQANILITSGESNVEERVPVKPDDQFRVASITKTFIAVEVLRLVAGGRVDLDEPLNVYLPETPHGDVVTVRQLLRHRSGYFDPVHDDPGFIPYIAENLNRSWTWDEILALAFQYELSFPPGTAYHYSNTNYMLLARIIEKLTHKPLAEVLAADLLAPLHLDHTFYATPEADTDPTSLVHGYATHPLTGEIIDTTSIPYATVLSVSADTMTSNASDLLKWSRALYGTESTVLNAAFQKQMLTFDSISNYGLGVFQFDTPIGTSFGHGGDTAGYLSQMEYIPTQDLSMVILVNSDAPSINLSEVRDLILVRMFGDSADAHLKLLISDLKSDNAMTRKNAILALGHSDAGNDQVISSLMESLRSDPVAENRKEAALALGLVGKDSDEARQALTDALKDGDKNVREAAQLALSILK